MTTWGPSENGRFGIVASLNLTAIVLGGFVKMKFTSFGCFHEFLKLSSYFLKCALQYYVFIWPKTTTKKFIFLKVRRKDSMDFLANALFWKPSKLLLSHDINTRHGSGSLREEGQDIVLSHNLKTYYIVFFLVARINWLLSM